MELFPVEGPWAGRLAVCSRPRAGSWLEDDILALRDANLDILVSALVAEEIEKLGLEPVGELCTRHGVEFIHFPVGNLQIPREELARPALARWLAALHNGRGLAVHCFASVGRSPTLAAALLIMGGVAPAEAWRRLELVRGRQVPDTSEQRDWAARFAPPSPARHLTPAPPTIVS
jgi:protein-tyrosine phosphatase